MKNIKKFWNGRRGVLPALLLTLLFLAALVTAMWPRQAKAALGFDTFNPNRFLLSMGSTNFSIGSQYYTNPPIDRLGFSGIGSLIFIPVTNGGAAVVTETIYSAPDRTNWVQYTNFPVNYQQSVVITNTYYGSTNLLNTNVVLSAGQFPVSPTAATAGYATPYIVPQPATNLTVNAATDYPVYAGINLDDIGRYIMVVTSVTGGTGATNGSMTIMLQGTTTSQGY